MNSKILIIDDDQELSSLLGEYLTSENLDCECVYDGLTGIEKLQTTKYDLVLLDVMLPGIDGFETLKRLRQFTKMPVLMLTAKGDDFDKILGLELGADDYLPKPFNHRELLARVKAILRRFDYAQESALGQSEDQIGIFLLDHNNQSLKYDSEEILLTGTEFQFLVYLNQNLSNLVSKEVLSKEVLGRRLMQFDRSIDMHMSNLRKKLKADPNIQIKTIRGAGYRLVVNN
ncbi:DNA-binding response regulator [Saccharobesus litoralis]|uniref:DNA-binding response regulator n=1 Tax=Saccharobesus litoralis TaxID=2172099 RepID=A0A2S0VLT8_9ALTE|nr:response regulator [Saccharobesus litoralis]AWB65178.1 DNA-binding response regulator [Saccharobesus litoralis]